MNYNDGRRITIGDNITYAGKRGRVVFVIQEEEFLEGYKPEDWLYLKEGIGVKLDDGELFCLDKADEDLLKPD
jgi:hypothetical protein